MTAWAVFWIGTGFEVGGLAVGAFGFRSTWRQFSAGDRFMEEYVEWIRRAGRAVGTLVRRVLRLERHFAPPTNQAGGSTARVSVTAGAVGSAGLPSLADDPEGFAAEVEARLGKLGGALYTVREQLKSEAEAREAADQQLRNNLEAKVADVEGMSRRSAVGGLPAQVLGWFCVAVGFTIQVVATPFM
jgi:hypothetical protein